MRQVSPLFRLVVKLDDDAFQDGNEASEVSRILRGIADRFDREHYATVPSGRLRDRNGNDVGSYGKRKETIG